MSQTLTPGPLFYFINYPILSFSHSSAFGLMRFFVKNRLTKTQGHKISVPTVPILEIGESAPPTQLLIIVVLLHTEGLVQSFFSSTV